MKWIVWFALLLLSAHALAFDLKDPEFIHVHTTLAKGLQAGERLLIRTDNKNWRNGKLVQYGYFIVCAGNDRVLFHAQIFPYAKEDESYQYDVSYSLCHSIEDATKDTDNQCELLNTIQINAFKDRENNVSVDFPEYTLDLSAYTGQESPCYNRTA